ncbi:hypothetical protein CEXT_458891, partial [Caerostris extrusa]
MSFEHYKDLRTFLMHKTRSFPKSFTLMRIVKFFLKKTQSITLPSR